MNSVIFFLEKNKVEVNKYRLLSSKKWHSESLYLYLVVLNNDEMITALNCLLLESLIVNLTPIYCTSVY